MQTNLSKSAPADLRNSLIAAALQCVCVFVSLPNRAPTSDITASDSLSLLRVTTHALFMQLAISSAGVSLSLSLTLGYIYVQHATRRWIILVWVRRLIDGADAAARLALIFMYVCVYFNIVAVARVRVCVWINNCWWLGYVLVKDWKTICCKDETFGAHLSADLQWV